MVTVAKVGDIEIIAVTDGQAAPIHPGWPFANVPPGAWQEASFALDHEGRHRSNFGAFVIRTRESTVLVDTGLGADRWEAQAPGADAGHLPESLYAEGIEIDSISTVVLTHLHFDHVGWNISRDEHEPVGPMFPRAKYLAPRADWDHWQGDVDPASGHHVKAFRESVLPLQEFGVLELVSGEVTVAQGIRTLPTPGHTPGHQSVLLESGSERGVVTGDVFHSAAQFTYPDWSHRADIDREAARRSRIALLDKLLPHDTVASGHLEFGSNLGTVATVQGRRMWRAFP